MLREPHVLVFEKPEGMGAYRALVNNREISQLHEKLPELWFFPVQDEEADDPARLRLDLRLDFGVDFDLDSTKDPRRGYTIVWKEEFDHLHGHTKIRRARHVRLTEGELFRMADVLLAHPQVIDLLAVPMDEKPLSPYELKEVFGEEGIDFEVMPGPREWSPRGPH